VMAVGGGMGRFMDLMESKEPQFKLIATPYPTSQSGGKPIFGQMDNQIVGIFTAITESNKHIAETVKFFDYFYSEEGRMIMNFGKEGTSYTMVDGYPKYMDSVMNNPEGLPLAQSLKQHVLSADAGPFL
ncbi:ABC transporter substrate-binding protein, partial [Clostridium perfringens]